MKIYTNKAGASHFKTDDYLKNLQPVEINTIEEFINAGLDPMALLDIKCLMVSRFDELVSDAPRLSDSDEPELIGEWVQIDFVKAMPYSEIFTEIFNIVQFDCEILNEISDICSFTDLSNDDSEIYEIVFNDINSKKIKISDGRIT